MMLFFKESKKIFFSLTFLIYLFAVAGFYFTQFVPDSAGAIEPPSRDREFYGMITREVPEILMTSATESLTTEHGQNCYAAYPFGFYKEVKLPEQKNAQIEEIIKELADVTSYGKFRELMKKADKIIGGGSKYSDSRIVENFSQVPKTYDDVLAEYNEIFEQDRITGAYARLFCDYIGILVSILPVFVTVSLVNADRRSHCEQVIHARKISSAKLIWTKFFALLVMMMIPVMILSVIATIQVKSIYPNCDVDMSAIPVMSICWLVPNVLFSTAFGMFVTELAAPLAAIFLQGILWVASFTGGAGKLTGAIGRFTLVCRHNSLYERYLFIEDLDKFVCNRIFYTLAAMLFIMLTVRIYDLKRKGDLHGIRKRSENSASQSET